MDTLSVAGKQHTAEFAQAKADYEAAGLARAKAEKSSQRLWSNLWEKSPGVYKPELDSVAGFNARLRELGIISPEQIASHPLVVAAREAIATLPHQIADANVQIEALEKPIAAINRQIDKDLAQLRDLNATLRSGAEALDTMRPFSDVIELPEGRQPPNALMNKLDYRMHEPRTVTKSRIIDNIAKRLKTNPDWQAYVARTAVPERLGVYHWYIPHYAAESDTKSAKLVADWIRMWGVGYRPGSPEWVAMQMAARDEFGLDAAIHTAAANAPAGERFYAENGAAVRALMRAMYDNTQQWFADNGITEIEVYRGFGWKEAQQELVPQGINWGPAERPNYGVADLELNPFQSFSADINISQGTGGAAAGAGFAGGGFGGGSDYSLLVGAKVPVERVLGTAQTGFGAKLESEIVVMGRASDTVSYRAGTSVEAALVQQAEEQTVSARELQYMAADGTKVSVVANADGTYTATLLDGKPLETRWTSKAIDPKRPHLGNVPVKTGVNLKVGKSKTYKTVDAINKLLRAAHISNSYTPPALEELAARAGEGELAAATEGLAATAENALRAQIERVPEDADAAEAAAWLRAQLPDAQHLDLAALPGDAARLIANGAANLTDALPDVAKNFQNIQVVSLADPSVRALASFDGKTLYLNMDWWNDLDHLASAVANDYDAGWHVAQTPEMLLGHEFGHLAQVNYGITDDTWRAAMDRIAAAGGNPLVSRYASDSIPEAFAETFTLLVYGEPTEAQLPIVREMARILESHGVDYSQLRSAVGAPPLPYHLK